MDDKMAIEVLERFQAQYSVVQFFRWEHLPEHLQEVSKAFGKLAARALLAVGLHADASRDLLQHPAEVAAGLRKLLEAKDCFVRAALK